MTIDLPTSARWLEACAGDGEFQLAARYWCGGLILRIGDAALAFTVADGVLSATEPKPGPGVLEFAGPVAVWERILAAVPPRFHNDLLANVTRQLGLKRSGDQLAHAQYYAAAMRAIELLRPAFGAQEDPPDQSPVLPGFDAPVGRYVRLSLQGAVYRIYFEEAGEGIPLLLQHTAGCHGSQWRHLFEEPRITRHFRLIAYDLPFHGKSLPPDSIAWWRQPYTLQGAFLRAVPVQLASALALHRPVFVGCSVGGLLALDLAYRHPELFRAVIAVEGALKVEGDLARMKELWHPQVSDDYKARLADGLMSPTSPTPYRKETSFVYASGWPALFLGDLHYYVNEFDLRRCADHIDTRRVGVHILSGEYDYSGTVELGREAHQAIAGSTWSEMKGVGHFPMSEHPSRFVEHLLPLLETIRAQSA